ncbi:Uncharacterised protein [Mycobacterium xenopi]|uniref:Uncharacterized protein n=1 Tax=Mycobacterium xenopi TaxID=1789 RepID=A0AAD1H4F2_MYCXE|nr:hypothetical protein MYXE_39720 [Mycobacterium xenopi]SPX88353.1 Uncharacterised protein [Mycobacterium xenopi]
MPGYDDHKVAPCFVVSTLQLPWRTQAKMHKAIAAPNAMSTHCTTAWSIHEPGGGAPGRMLRNGTMANRFAAYNELSFAIYQGLFAAELKRRKAGCPDARYAIVRQRRMLSGYDDRKVGHQRDFGSVEAQQPGGPFLMDGDEIAFRVRPDMRDAVGEGDRA